MTHTFSGKSWRWPTFDMWFLIDSTKHQMHTYFVNWVLKAGFSKHLRLVLRRDSNKSHIIPEIRSLERCKTANLSRVSSGCLEKRLKFAILHRLSNRISGIRCDLFKTRLECFEYLALNVLHLSTAITQSKWFRSITEVKQTLVGHFMGDQPFQRKTTPVINQCSLLVHLRPGVYVQ